MKSGHQKVALAACFLIAGAAGYCFQSLCDRPVSAFTIEQTAGLDYFLTVRSFSEVENARALLEAVAFRSLQELRIRRILIRPTSTGLGMSAPVREQRLAEVIRDYRESIREFAGTGQEMAFVQDLLGIYKREGRFQEWVSLFLHQVYQNPTHEVIGRMAEEALIVARDAQSEAEVVQALRHLRDIPIDFTAKPAVESALARMADGLYLARSGTVVAAGSGQD